MDKLYPTRIDLAKLIPPNSQVVELGVAKGLYSEALLKNTDGGTCVHSIDRWTDRGHHREYDGAVKLLSQYGNRSKVYRSEFKDAVSQFSDSYFDFIFIDGYAHTGQDGGDTLEQWWSKCKPGGIFAGHDYIPKYQITIDAVDNFCLKNNLELHTTDDSYASWWVRKHYDDDLFSKINWLFDLKGTRNISRLNTDEAAVITKWAKKTSSPYILEIGSRHNGTSALLSTAIGDRTHHAIDINPKPDKRALNYLGTRNFNQIVGNSRTYKYTNEYEFVFVDGDHSYTGVKLDTENVWSSVPVGGVIAFHDALPNEHPGYCGGVFNYVNELICDKRVCEIDRARSVIVTKKIK